MPEAGNASIDDLILGQKIMWLFAQLLYIIIHNSWKQHKYWTSAFSTDVFLLLLAISVFATVPCRAWKKSRGTEWFMSCISSQKDYPLYSQWEYCAPFFTLPAGQGCSRVSGWWPVNRAEMELSVDSERGQGWSTKKHTKAWVVWNPYSKEQSWVLQGLVQECVEPVRIRS